MIADIENVECPWLPEACDGSLGPEITRRHGQNRGAAFYIDALRYAQAQWLAGKPAQAILQLNKAWMADPTDSKEALEKYPPPYRALVWILQRASTDPASFVGNPVRHFQHLASRVSGPRKEIRSWRAWVCFHLAERALPPRFSRDGEQIAREGLWIPAFSRALKEVGKSGWPGEVESISEAVSWATLFGLFHQRQGK